jgi:hypothetical protein
VKLIRLQYNLGMAHSTTLRQHVCGPTHVTTCEYGPCPWNYGPCPWCDNHDADDDYEMLFRFLFFLFDVNKPKKTRVAKTMTLTMTTR